MLVAGTLNPESCYEFGSYGLFSFKKVWHNKHSVCLCCHDRKLYFIWVKLRFEVEERIQVFLYQQPEYTITVNLFLEKRVPLNKMMCLSREKTIKKCFSVNVYLLRNQNNQKQNLLKNFIKKETLADVFSSEFCEISKNIVSTEHLQTTASE